MNPPVWFNVVFLVVGILFTGFYGWQALEVFEAKTIGCAFVYAGATVAPRAGAELLRSGYFYWLSVLAVVNSNCEFQDGYTRPVSVG